MHRSKKVHGKFLLQDVGINTLEHIAEAPFSGVAEINILNELMENEYIRMHVSSFRRHRVLIIRHRVIASYNRSIFAIIIQG